MNKLDELKRTLRAAENYHAAMLRMPEDTDAFDDALELSQRRIDQLKARIMEHSE